MLWLFAIVLGVVFGLVTGGRIGNLAGLRFRWPWLIIAAVVVRESVVLTPLGRVDGARYAYVLALAAIVAWTIWQFDRVRGIWLITAGAALNLLVIVVNGARMPVAPEFAVALLRRGNVGQYTVMAMLVVRGIFTLFKRWLILRERIAPEETPDERTLETHRALFWRRLRSLAIILAIYFAIYFVFFGLGPLEAMDALPGVIAAAIPQLAYFLVIMVANFMLFFGAFFIYGRIGRTYVDPGEANYEVTIEDVRGQKSAVD